MLIKKLCVHLYKKDIKIKTLLRLVLLFAILFGIGLLYLLPDKGLAQDILPAKKTIIAFGTTHRRMDLEALQRRFRSLQKEYRRKQASGYDLSEVNPLVRQLVEANKEKDWNRFAKLLEEISRALEAAKQATVSVNSGSRKHDSQFPEELMIHSPYSFGIFNAHVYDGTRFNDDLAVELGIQVTRVQLLWSDFQQSEGEFRFGYPDHLIGVHNDAKITPVVTLLCSSPWATRAKRGRMKFTSSQPKNMSQYVQFITKVVNRYKRKVKYWQIENEVYYPFFWDGTKEEYLELLKYAYAAIKRVDPEAKVVLAGFPDEMFFRIRDGHRASREFFEYLMDKGRNYFDVIDFHQYFEPEDVYVQVRQLNQSMRTYGYQKELICTEAGGLDIRLLGIRIASSGIGQQKRIPVIQQLLSIPEVPSLLHRLSTNGFTPEEFKDVATFVATNDETRPVLERYQPQDLVKRVCLTFSQGVRQIHWVAMKDLDKDIAMDWFHVMMGLVDKRERKKPAYYTYKLLIEKLRGFVSSDEIKDNPKIFRFSFTNKAPVYVAWSDTATNADFTDYLSAPKARIAHIITEQWKTDRDAKVEIVPTNAVGIYEMPIFIEAAD